MELFSSRDEQVPCVRVVSSEQKQRVQTTDITHKRQQDLTTIVTVTVRYRGTSRTKKTIIKSWSWSLLRKSQVFQVFCY